MLPLLLLTLLLLLDSLFEPAASLPELAPVLDSCMAVGALPAVLRDLAPPPPTLLFATALFVAALLLPGHAQSAALVQP